MSSFAAANAIPVRAPRTGLRTLRGEAAVDRLGVDSDKPGFALSLGSRAELQGTARVGELRLATTDNQNSTSLVSQYDDEDAALYPLDVPVPRSIPERTWNAVAWSEELGLFVAVGNALALATSPDGVVWTERPVPGTSVNLLGITWAKEIGRFVGVGANRIVYSSDGSSWTSAAPPVNMSWYGPAWSPELRLMVAGGATSGVQSIMTSSDGITWRTQSVPSSFHRAVVWSAELGRFIACGGDPHLYSNDGITWLTSARGYGDETFSAIWSPERRRFVTAGTASVFQTSVNGTSWTTQAGFTQGIWRGVSWAKELGLFMAAGVSEVLYSPNAPAVASTGNFPTRYLHGQVTLNDGSIVVWSGNGGGTNVSRSTDFGATWTTNWGNSPNGTYFAYAIDPSDGSIYMAGGNNSFFVNRSTNGGVSWTTPGGLPSNRQQMPMVVWPGSPSTLVVMGGFTTGLTNDILRSSDGGVTWTSVTTARPWAARADHEAVLWRDAQGLPWIVLMGGYNLTALVRDIWRSNDAGETWTQVVASAPWSARYAFGATVVPRPGKADVIVIYGGGGSFSYPPLEFSDIWISEDGGFIWTQITPSVSLGARRYPAMSTVVTSDGSAYAISTAGLITVTTSGNTTETATSDVRRITILKGDSRVSRRFATSSDGTTWTSRVSPRGFNVSAITWAPKLNRFAAVGTNDVAGAPRCVTIDVKSRDVVSRDRFETGWFMQAVGGNAWYDIAHSLTLRRVVSVQNGAYAYSSDGIHWTSVNTGVMTTGLWRGVIWIPELSRFVAVGIADGINARVGYSSDGITWTTVNQAGLTQGKWWPVAWAPELRRMVALNNPSTSLARAAYSSDGISWTTISSPNTTERWFAMSWSPELRRFVALSFASGRINPSAGAMYSSDGISWVTYNDAVITAGNWYSMAWSSSLRRFVAVSNATALRCAYSDTGLPGSWRTVGGAATANSWQSVHWNPDLARFEAYAGSSSAPYRMESPDGINWTTVADTTLSSQAHLWSEWIPWLNRTIVNSNNVAHRSSPLVTRRTRALRRVDTTANSGEGPWVTRSSAVDNFWYSLVWVPERQRLVAVASGSGSGNRVMVSDNYGDTWQTRSSAENNGWRSVAWIPEAQRLVAVANVGVSGARVMVSDNYGDTWQTRSSATDNEWYSVAWIPEAQRLVAVSSGASSGDRVMVSDNYGDTWQTRSSATDNTWFSVVWIPEAQRLVAVAINGSGDRVMVSDNYGDTWQTRSSAVDNGWYSVAWIPEAQRLVAVSGGIGSGDRVMVSDNYGDTWQTRSSAADNQWSVAWIPEAQRLVAVASSGISGARVMVSDNYGDTWQTRSSARDHGWWSVAWIPEAQRLVAVADSGTGGNRVMIQSYASSAAPSSTALSVANKTILKTSETGITVYGTVASFTGAHDVRVTHPATPALSGRIACAHGHVQTVSLSEALPDVRLCTSARDPSVYGVFNVQQATSSATSQVLVNGIGEGAMWVCDAAGAIENGDYVCSSGAAGYGMKQSEEWQCAHTVAKALFDCDFAEEPAPEPQPEPTEGNAGADAGADAGAEAAPADQAPIEEITTPGAEQLAEQIAAAVPSVPTYYGLTDETRYELRYLVQRDEPDALTGDNTAVVSREDYEAARAEGKQVWRAALMGCTYHCS